MGVTLEELNRGANTDLDLSCKPHFSVSFAKIISLDASEEHPLGLDEDFQMCQSKYHHLMFRVTHSRRKRLLQDMLRNGQRHGVSPSLASSLSHLIDLDIFDIVFVANVRHEHTGFPTQIDKMEVSYCYPLI